MRVFIDESGSFTGQNNISAVGALVVPDLQFKGFQKLYGRLRRKLPQEKGEVKGRLLDERQVADVCEILRKVGCLFEVVVVDSALQSENDVSAHRTDQATRLTKHLTQRGPKVYSLHAPEVECIGKGKAHRPYEFGVKVSVATTLAHAKGGQFVAHVKALPGNPYDGHTLSTVIPEMEELVGKRLGIHGDRAFT